MAEHDEAEDTPFLSPLMSEIAEVAGLDAARILLREKGGQRVYIPFCVADAHWLVHLVGREAANKICGHFATHVDVDDRSRHGCDVTLPACSHGARQRIRKMAERLLSQGVSVNRVAKETGYSNRTLYYLKAQLRNRRESAEKKRKG